MCEDTEGDFDHICRICKSMHHIERGAEVFLQRIWRLNECECNFAGLQRSSHDSNKELHLRSGNVDQAFLKHWEVDWGPEKDDFKLDQKARREVPQDIAKMIYACRDHGNSPELLGRFEQLFSSAGEVVKLFEGQTNYNNYQNKAEYSTELYSSSEESKTHQETLQTIQTGLHFKEKREEHHTNETSR